MLEVMLKTSDGGLIRGWIRSEVRTWPPLLIWHDMQRGNRIERWFVLRDDAGDYRETSPEEVTPGGTPEV